MSEGLRGAASIRTTTSFSPGAGTGASAMESFNRPSEVMRERNSCAIRADIQRRLRVRQNRDESATSYQAMGCAVDVQIGPLIPRVSALARTSRSSRRDGGFYRAALSAHWVNEVEVCLTDKLLASAAHSRLRFEPRSSARNVIACFALSSILTFGCVAFSSGFSLPGFDHRITEQIAGFTAK